MMLLSVALMTAAMLATALLPTYSQVGIAAGAAAVPAALRDGFLGRRRIYRRGRLSARGRAAPPPRADRLDGLGSERNRRFARGRHLGADRRLDERGRPCQLGLANPVPVRRGARGKRVGRPLDDGGIARIPPPAGSRAPCPLSPLRHSLANHKGCDRPRLRHLGAGLDHLLCRDHLRPRFPDLGRQAQRKRLAVAVDRRRSGRDPGHSARRRSGPTVSAASRCWSLLSLGNAVLPATMFA